MYKKPKSILNLLIRPDIGLIGLLLLSLGMGIFIGTLLKSQKETRIQQERLDAAEAASNARAPKLTMRTNEAALTLYYQERIASLPPEHRPNPNQAPQDALAAQAKPNDTQEQESVEVLPEADIAILPPDMNMLPDVEIASLPQVEEEGDKQPAWLRFAASTNAINGAMVAIILDDIGINKQHSKAAIALDAPLTLAFLPYANNLPPLVESARANGHEIMLHLPMEPISRDADPGPNALLTSLERSELKARLEWNFARLEGYVGVNNHMGSLFTSDAELMAFTLDYVKKRGLMFLDSVTSGKTQGYKLAQSMNMPHAVRDIFIDHEIEQSAIKAQLRLVEKTALEKGHAVAIGHPHALTLAALRDWLPSLAAKGITPVPVSTIVKRQRKITDENQLASH